MTTAKCEYSVAVPWHVCRPIRFRSGRTAIATLVETVTDELKNRQPSRSTDRLVPHALQTPTAFADRNRALQPSP